MLSSIKLQSAYIDLYTALRKYIWDFKTVEKLADLEVAVYQTFPDMQSVSTCFNALNADVQAAQLDDNDLDTAIQRFADTITTNDTIYVSLHQVNEVIQNENI